MPDLRLRDIEWTGLAAPAILLAAWEGLVRSGIVSYQFFPAPSAILTGARQLASDGVLIEDLVHTLFSIGMGWSAAMVIGVTGGLLLGFSSLARSWVLASIDVLRPIPGIAFAPVGLLLFGFSIQTELAIAFLPTLWPILINTMGGVANVQSRLLDVGRTFRLSRSEVVFHLLLPAALPSIIVGARTGLGLALVMSIVAEIVGNPAGLGYAIVREQQAMNPEAMFAYIFVVGFLGVILNSGVVNLTNAIWPFLKQMRAA